MSGRKLMEDKQSEADEAGPIDGVPAGASGSGGRRAATRGAPSALGGDIQAKIGQHLRAMYDDVVRQGVPDRFMDLLARLDAREDDRETGR